MTPEAFVDHVRDTYVLSPGSEQLLERTAACLRRYDVLMATLAVEGHYHLSARGRLQPHPALASSGSRG